MGPLVLVRGCGALVAGLSVGRLGGLRRPIRDSDVVPRIVALRARPDRDILVDPPRLLRGRSRPRGQILVSFGLMCRGRHESLVPIAVILPSVVLATVVAVERAARPLDLDHLVVERHRRGRRRRADDQRAVVLVASARDVARMRIPGPRRAEAVVRRDDSRRGGSDDGSVDHLARRNADRTNRTRSEVRRVHDGDSVDHRDVGVIVRHARRGLPGIGVVLGGRERNPADRRASAERHAEAPILAAHECDQGRRVARPDFGDDGRAAVPDRRRRHPSPGSSDEEPAAVMVGSPSP